MPTKRILIVNADDFGQSLGINRGIITAYEQGIVTSASLMVRWSAAVAAAAYGRAHPDFSLGLHVDLGEWKLQNRIWVPVYEVIPLDERKTVAEEIVRQLDRFRQLMERDPTHLDSHQHVHRREPVYTVMLELARSMGIPLRHYHPNIRYCGSFYGQTATGDPLPDILSVGGLLEILTALPPGITELGCHPGIAYDLDSMYRDERSQEVAVLCDAKVRAAIIDGAIELGSFDNIVSLSA